MVGGRRRRIGLRVAAGASAVAVLVATVYVQRRADAEWRTVRTWMTAQSEAVGQRNDRRSALHGDLHTGSAFAEYDAAMRSAAELLERPGEEGMLRDLRLRRDEMDPAEVRAVRARWESAVRTMRGGAHCDDARPNRPPDAVDGVHVTELLAGRSLVNMACVEAAELLAAGRGVEAAAHTLDAATFGADLMSSPLIIDKMVGNALVAIATHEFWTDERLAALDADGLAALAAGLERLDPRLPVTLDLHGEALYVARSLTERAGATDEVGVSSLAAWRYGFSTRWMCADAILEIRRSLERLDRSVASPWPERQRALELEADRLSGCGNVVVQMAWPILVRVEGNSLRQVVALVRLLRIGVEIQRGLEPSPLPDPLGDGPLAVVETADGVRISSQGRIRDEPLEREAAHPTPR